MNELHRKLKDIEVELNSKQEQVCGRKYLNFYNSIYLCDYPFKEDLINELHRKLKDIEVELNSKQEQVCGRK